MLSCYKVLDLTNEKGFLCGKALGDLGADVIKIEKPGGDPGRKIGPFYHDIPDPEKSLNWFAFNANKRGITLDIETTEGREIFKKLVKIADVVIESFAPGYMDKLGLGYAALSHVNPRIVLTSISGFGQEGPYRNYNDRDIAVWALSGFMYIMGDPDRPPLAPSYPHGYLIGAMNGALGTMVALCHCQLTGVGQQVDASSHQGLVFSTFIETHVPWHLQRTFLRREGRNRWQVTAKDGRISLPSLWECKDGAFAFFMLTGPTSVTSNTAMVEWMRKDGIDPGVLGRWDWNTMDWSNFTVNDAKEVAQTFNKFFLQHTMMELLEGALTYDIQMTPLLKPKDQLKFPQFVDRKFFIEVEHPELCTKITYPGGFARFTEAACGIRFRAPLIGEHNDEVYKKELDLSTEELVALKQRNVI